MVMDEFKRWDDRYRTPEFVFGSEPNYFLAACRHLLPPSGHALAIGDGEGRNGVWLAQQNLDVTSIDFSPAAQQKAAALARSKGVDIHLETADMHTWRYPESTFDVVVDIFTQVSTPAERDIKWAGVRKTLKPGGLLLIEGYTPKQLQHGTGGPKQVENLYTRAMLEDAFDGFRDMRIVEKEIEMHEGNAHSGMSAVIEFAARKP